MRPLRLVLIALLALFAATGVFYAWQQRQALADARAAANALDKERNSLRKQLWEAQRKRAELEAQLRERGLAANGASRDDAPPRPDDAPPEAFQRGPGEGGPMGRLLELMNNPEAQRLAALQQRGMLDARYAALFRKLNLTPEQLEQFKNLLVEKRAAVADVMAAAREQGLSGRDNRDEIRALVENAQAEVDASIRSAIGDTAYAQYESFEQTQAQRTTVERLDQRLSYSGTPLTTEQSDQLVEILAASSTETSSNNRTTRNAAARLGLAGAGSGTQITDAAVQQASTILSAAQLQALQQVQQEQQAQNQLGQIVREQMRNRSTGTTTSNTPTPPPPPGG